MPSRAPSNRFQLDASLGTKDSNPRIFSSPPLMRRVLIRHGVAVAARVGAGESIPARGIDDDRGRAARDRERLDPGDVVAARLQLVKHRIGNLRLDIELVEAAVMRPERTVEVQRLDARPFERLMQVRIPVGPELYDVQECLDDRLLLIVASGRT